MADVKMCREEGCHNPARWVNSKNKKYKAGGYYTSMCTTCNNLADYGINTPQRDAMLKEQDYRCAMPDCQKEIEFSGVQNCPQEKQAVVDHHHASGTVRRILCATCNRSLGHFETSVHRHKLFAQYLEENA